MNGVTRILRIRSRARLAAQKAERRVSGTVVRWIGVLLLVLPTLYAVLAFVFTKLNSIGGLSTMARHDLREGVISISPVAAAFGVVILVVTAIVVLGILSLVRYARRRSS
jgi:hypothetical protein